MINNNYFRLTNVMIIYHNYLLNQYDYQYHYHCDCLSKFDHLWIVCLMLTAQPHQSSPYPKFIT